jgi:hypothetical protein
MTRTVADAALTMQVCAGPDERDPFSLPRDGANYVRGIRGSIKGLRVAYAEDLGTSSRSTPRCGERRRRRPGSSASWAAGWTTRRPAGRRPRSAGTRSSAADWGVRLQPFRDRRAEIEPGLQQDHGPRRRQSAEPLRAGLDGAPGVVAASPRLLRAVRSPPDADRRLPAVRAGARSSARGRRARRSCPTAGSRTRIPSTSRGSRRRPFPAGSRTTACPSGSRSSAAASTT